MFTWSIRRRSFSHGWSDPDTSCVFATGDGGQGFTFAGACDAFAIFDQEQCAVCRALNQTGTAVEKLIGQPFQRYATMGAAVFINKHLPVAAYGEYGQAIPLKAATFSLGNLAPIAQVFQLCLLGA